MLLQFTINKCLGFAVCGLNSPHTKPAFEIRLGTYTSISWDAEKDCTNHEHQEILSLIYKL